MELSVLAIAGLASGMLNVVAGGGSFIILPLLLFLGLPATVANATNRVGVVAQTIGSLWGFHQHGSLDWRWALRATAPAVAGAAIGVWAALYTPDIAFRRILSIAMVAVTLWSLLRPRAPLVTSTTPVPASNPWIVGSFFVVGLYAGFIQAGVGFLVLAITTTAGMDLLRGNAVKVLSVLVLTGLSLAAFAATGHVDWPRGLALGAGNLVGGVIGVRLAVAMGHAWLERLVTVAVVIFAFALWL